MSFAISFTVKHRVRIIKNSLTLQTHNMENKATEHKLFGEDGFETMVNKVADMEKSLSIYDVAQLTPKV